MTSTTVILRPGSAAIVGKSGGPRGLVGPQGLSGPSFAVTLTELRASDVVENEVIVDESGRRFIGVTSDQTSLIDGSRLAIDGVWGIAPDSDPTGASGAWQCLDAINLLDYITSRNSKLPNLIRAAKSATVPVGQALGDSLMQGTGVQDDGGTLAVNFTIPRVVGTSLQTMTGVSDNNTWTPNSVAVGGSNLASVISYLADNADATGFPESGTLTAGKDYALVTHLRNESSQLALTRYKELLPTALGVLASKGVETFVITDPPKRNATTGVIEDTQANFGDWYDVFLSKGAEYSITVADIWRLFSDLDSFGFNLDPLYFDTVHCTNNGYAIMGKMAFLSLITAPLGQSVPSPAATIIDRVDAVSVYDDIDTTATTTITGLTTSSTSRRKQTGEVTTEVYELADGETISFQSPLPAEGVIVQMLGGVSGTISATYDNVSIGGGQGAEGGAVRETGVYFPLVRTVSPFSELGVLTLTSTGSTRILGPVFLGPRAVQKYARPRDAVEVDGSVPWVDSTFDASGASSRRAGGTGATSTMQVYGSYLLMDYGFENDSGRFQVFVDGVLQSFQIAGDANVTDIECYTAGTEQVLTLAIVLGDTGFHEVKIETIAKNPSSGGSFVKIGNFRNFVSQSVPREIYLNAVDSEVVELRQPISAAVIAKTVSGTPHTLDAIDGQAFTLKGTGTAIVRVQ